MIQRSRTETIGDDPETESSSERGHLHFDCAAGIAGDMFLGACLEVGLPLRVLEGVVEALELEDVGVDVRRSRRGGIAGTRFRVLRAGEPIDGPDPDEEQGLAAGNDSAAAAGHLIAPGGEHHGAGDRSPPSSSQGHSHARQASHGHDYRQLARQIDRCRLDAAVRERASSMLRRLAEVEARMHDVTLDAVHFHEVGAVDSLVDIVGAAAAMHHLAPATVSCGPLVLGSGSVRTAHGVLPVPSPAAAELLRGTGCATVIASSGELVTPTGALIVSEFVTHFVGGAPGDAGLAPLRIDAVGYGLGRRELADRPNAFRLTLGRRATAAPMDVRPEVCVIECQVDDVSAEIVAHAAQRMLVAGALDVLCSAVQMKKGRPGTLVQVLCRPADLDRLAGVLLLETGSFGCRFQRLQRFELERTSLSVRWRQRDIAVKLGRLPEEAGASPRWIVSPEYEDCSAAALATGVAVREVFDEVRSLALRELASGGLHGSPPAAPGDDQEGG
mgnify:FL=1